MITYSCKNSKLIHTSYGKRGFNDTYSRKKSQLINTSIGERGFEIKYSLKKLKLIHPSTDELGLRLHTRAKEFNLTDSSPDEREFKITHSRKRSQHANEDSRLHSHKKILIHSNINWRTRIRGNVLTQKSKLIHTSSGERGFDIKCPPKKSHLINTSTGER